MVVARQVCFHPNTIHTADSIHTLGTRCRVGRMSISRKMCIPRLLFAREMGAICTNLAVDILTPAKARRPKYGEGTVLQLGYVPSLCLLEERMRTSKLVVLLIVTLTALLFIIRSADAQTV